MLVIGVIVIISIITVILSAFMAMYVWLKSEGNPNNTFFDDYGASDNMPKHYLDD